VELKACSTGGAPLRRVLTGVRVIQAIVERRRSTDVAEVVRATTAHDVEVATLGCSKREMQSKHSDGGEDLRVRIRELRSAEVRGATAVEGLDAQLAAEAEERSRLLEADGNCDVQPFGNRCPSTCRW